MKKVLASILAASMLLCGCGGSETKEETKAPELALVTDSGSINDKSFNQSAWEGVKEVGDSKGLGYQYYKPSTFDDAGYSEAIELAVDSGAKVVVLPGFKFAAAIDEAQTKYADVKFILIDSTPSGGVINDNLYCALFAEQESGYLAGYAAVKDGYTKLGFMGGIALPAVINFGYGYIQGARDAAKELGVTVEINYTYTGTFNESPEIKTMAAAWYNNGTEIIFSCGGQICNSIFAAAEEAGAKAIGVDSDQKDASTCVVTSAMKGVKTTVITQLNAYLDGTFTGGLYTLTAANGGVQISDDFSRFNTFTQAEYETLFESVKTGAVEIKNFEAFESADGFNDATVTVNVQ